MHIESSMKFIRWVLSHLTLIIVLSLVLYAYWNRSDFWPDDAEKPPRMEASDAWTDSEKELKYPGLAIVDKNMSESETSSLKYGNIVIKDVEDGKTLQYPGDVADTENVTGKDSNQEFDGFDIVNTKNPEIGSSESQNEFSYSAATDYSGRMRRYKQDLSAKQQKAMENANKVFQQVTEEELVKYPDEEETGSVNIEPKAGGFDKKLQAQIRARQKQLQNQMVSLIPIGKNKAENYNELAVKKNSEVKPVKPLTKPIE